MFRWRHKLVVLPSIRSRTCRSLFDRHGSLDLLYNFVVCQREKKRAMYLRLCSFKGIDIFKVEDRKKEGLENS